MPIILLAVIILLALMVAASCVRIVPQAHAMIIERLGMYKETWSTGLHFKLPFFDRIAKRVNLKEQVVDFAPQQRIMLQCGLIRLCFSRLQTRDCLLMEWKIRLWRLKT